MTGMAAATFMLDGKVGVLRTMPAPDEETIARFRRQVDALGVPWEPDLQYGEYLRTLDPSKTQHLAVIHAAASLFRGAGYTAFDGELPADTTQAAVAVPVCARDRAAAAACRPLRTRHVRGALPRARRAEMGARRTARAAAPHGVVGWQGEPARSAVAQRDRGSAAELAHRR